MNSFQTRVAAEVAYEALRLRKAHIDAQLANLATEEPDAAVQAAQREALSAELAELNAALRQAKEARTEARGREMGAWNFARMGQPRPDHPLEIIAALLSIVKTHGGRFTELPPDAQTAISAAQTYLQTPAGQVVLVEDVLSDLIAFEATYEAERRRLHQAVRRRLACTRRPPQTRQAWEEERDRWQRVISDFLRLNADVDTTSIDWQAWMRHYGAHTPPAPASQADERVTALQGQVQRLNSLLGRLAEVAQTNHDRAQRALGYEQVILLDPELAERLAAHRRERRRPQPATPPSTPSTPTTRRRTSHV